MANPCSMSHTIENSASISNYASIIEFQELEHSFSVTIKHQKTASSTPHLVTVLVMVILLLAAVSPFLVNMLLMRSRDVEPTPGPTILTLDDLNVLYEALYPARANWNEVGVK